MATDDILLRVETSPFPIGFCPSNNQELADAIAKSIEVFFPGEFSLTIKSSSQPTVEQRSMTWNKIDASTGQSLGYFEWNLVVGAWTKEHWPNGIPTFERRIFVGTLTQLETYDGGEPGTISQSTGPFWQQDTDFTDQWPIGVGTLATTPLDDATIFDDAAPGAPDAIGVYFIKPTARIWDRGT